MRAFPAVRSWLVIAAAVCVAAAQDPVGSYARSDLSGLRAAAAKFPDNAGLQLRAAQAIIVEGRNDYHADRTASRVAEIQTRYEQAVATNPEALRPLQEMAGGAYRVRKFDLAVSLGRRALALDPTDSETVGTVVKALIRLNKDNEAAAALLDWVKAGSLMSFGSSQGRIASVLPRLTDALRTGFKKLVDDQPRAVFVRLGYAVFLQEVGEIEEAWKQFHQAEMDGLFEPAGVGRHPFALSLASRSGSEPKAVGAADFSDLAELARQVQEHPEHLGLRLRYARRLELPLTKIDKRKDDAPDPPLDYAKLEPALAQYRAVAAANPDCWFASFRLGELLVRCGHAAEAVAPLERAMQTFDVFQAGLLTLIDARVRAGQLTEAAADYVKFARRVEPGARARAMLKDLIASGKSPVAAFLAATQAAATASPKNPYLQATISHLAHLANQAAVAQAAAVAAERLGLSGPGGWPHEILMEAFDIKAATADSRP